MYNSSSATFNSTIIAFSGGAGIYFYNGASSQIEYSNIFDNSGGDIAFEDDNSSHGPPNIGTISTTNANGDSCDTYYNIFLDPMFVDGATGDYLLLEGSPCIDAGDPELPLNPDSTIADIGAFYYDQLEMVVEPSNLYFDSVFVGNIGMLTCILHNPSYSVIIIQSISINDSAFSHDWNLADSVLASGDSLQIVVTFAPYSSTVYEDSLSIEIDHHDKIVPLFGVGLGAYVELNPLSLDFGAVEYGYPETLSVSCSNLGNIYLEIAHILDCPPNFQVLQLIDSSIIPGDSTILLIEFNPESFGMFECDLGIISNAYNAETTWVSCSGEGGLTPAAVKDLTLIRTGTDALLRWSPVDTSIQGSSVTVDYYIIYHSPTVQGPYYFLGSTDTTTYSHANVIPFEETMFYEVTAYVGSIGILQSALAELGKHPRREELSKRLGKPVLTVR